jgi:hypothetical protein
MIKKTYKFKKFEIELIIPKEIELFIQAAKLRKADILSRPFWKMEVEDNIFYSHTKHPTEKDYESFGEKPLSKSKKIKVLLHGLYYSSDKIFVLKPSDFVKKISLCESSCNIKGGWRLYFSFYE